MAGPQGLATPAAKAKRRRDDTPKRGARCPSCSTAMEFRLVDLERGVYLCGNDKQCLYPLDAEGLDAFVVPHVDGVPTLPCPVRHPSPPPPPSTAQDDDVPPLQPELFANYSVPYSFDDHVIGTDSAFAQQQQQQQRQVHADETLYDQRSMAAAQPYTFTMIEPVSTMGSGSGSGSSSFLFSNMFAADADSLVDSISATLPSTLMHEGTRSPMNQDWLDRVLPAAH